MRSTLVNPLRGMGYVPGVVRGRLTRNPETKGVLLADHKTLQGLSASPAGCVLLDAAPFSHVSIGLLSRGIPAVIVGAGEASQLDEGLEVILDGAAGRVLRAEADDADLTLPPPPAPRNLRTLDGEGVDMRVSGARRPSASCAPSSCCLARVWCRTKPSIPGPSRRLERPACNAASGRYRRE